MARFSGASGGPKKYNAKKSPAIPKKPDYYVFNSWYGWLKNSKRFFHGVG